MGGEGVGLQGATWGEGGGMGLLGATWQGKGGGGYKELHGGRGIYPVIIRLCFPVA